RAHAARVGSLAAVVGPLVVARGRQRDVRLAVDQHDHADLGALEALLEHDLGVGLLEYCLDRRARLVLGLGHGHALAGPEPRVLHDQRRPHPLQVRQGVVEVAERGELGRGHPVAAHELLGVALAALEARPLRAGAEHLVTALAQSVCPARYQRGLRPDDHEVGALGLDDDAHAALVAGAADHARGVVHAVVAGHHDHVVDRRRAVEGPAQGVLAPARPDDEHLHGVTAPRSTSLTASGYATCSSVRMRAARASSSSPGSTGTRRCTITLPVSTPASTKWTLQPLSRTPSSSAWRCACRPRCFGRRLGWTFSRRPCHLSTNAGERTRMKPARQTRSTPRAVRRPWSLSSKASRVSHGRWVASTPASRARSSAGADAFSLTTSATSASSPPGGNAAISAARFVPL